MFEHPIAILVRAIHKSSDLKLCQKKTIPNNLFCYPSFSGRRDLRMAKKKYPGNKDYGIFKMLPANLYKGRVFTFGGGNGFGITADPPGST